jgi:sec-independent protein translocase protein TatA
MFRGLFQPMHLLIILGIALVVVGPGKLPEIGKGLGKSIREFKKIMSAEEEKPTTEAKKETAPQETLEMKKEATSMDTAEVKKESIPQDTTEKKA